MQSFDYGVDKLCRLSELELRRLSFADAKQVAEAIRRGMDHMQPGVRSEFAAELFRSP